MKMKEYFKVSMFSWNIAMILFGIIFALEDLRGGMLIVLPATTNIAMFWGYIRQK